MTPPLPTSRCPICQRSDERIYRVSGLLLTAPRKDDTLSEQLRKDLTAPTKPPPPTLYELGWQGLLVAVVFLISLLTLADRHWLLLPLALTIIGGSTLLVQGRIWQRQLAQWEMQRGKWDELYYCFYDDRVYLPGGQETRPPYRMQELLK